MSGRPVVLFVFFAPFVVGSNLLAVPHAAIWDQVPGLRGERSRRRVPSMLQRSAAAFCWVFLVISCGVRPAGGAVGVEQAPQSSPWLLEAQKAQAKGLVLKAVELAGKAVEEAPKDPRGWYFRASLLERSKQWDGVEADLSKVLELKPNDPSVTLQRGVARLRLGRFPDAVADFDRYAELRPGSLPELWQRGIALFYARRFDEGRKQFELHRTVNGDDVENAAWHFACVAQLEGFRRARELLIPVVGDSRIPMKEIQGMLAGTTTPEEVLAAAEGVPGGARRDAALFYARLYVGMYEEARGRLDLAAKHLAEATKTADGFGLMGDVGRLHADWLAREIRRAR
ncbi:MAG: tetratricopeptide repeat protein [Limisphaerales bacterium]